MHVGSMELRDADAAQRPSFQVLFRSHPDADAVAVLMLYALGGRHLSDRKHVAFAAAEAVPGMLPGGWGLGVQQG